jgi:hypothetical protein
LRPATNDACLVWDNQRKICSAAILRRAQPEKQTARLNCYAQKKKSYPQENQNHAREIQARPNDQTQRKNQAPRQAQAWGEN